MTPFDRAVLVAAILAATVSAMVLVACWFTLRARRISPEAAAERLRLREVGEDMVREGYFR
ncbi:hypothetical protein [Streptomyces sp.]|uniref:hypothetical protein n=1 Tax=Streptomyces sp. TaxID=1931 RepID=UPI002F92EAD0